MATAAKAFFREGGTNTVTRRKSVPIGGTSIALPPKIRAGVFKNAGANDIKLRINSSETNFWTLAPNDISPKIQIKGATINAAGVGGSSILECFLEG